MWPGALHVFRWIILLAALAPFGYYVLAMIAARRFFGRPPALPRDFTPPVSILKPIKRLDREAYENYASFCSQDYPDYEVLFCVPDDSDPAIPVLQKVIAEHPHCRARLLIGAEELGTSKKVNKLVRLVREARHDFFVISDSDIRVAPDYLRSVVAHFSDSRVAAVTCLYRGLTDGSLPSVLEALGNSSDFAAGVLCAWLLGRVDFTLGATMATRRERLAEIGGFEALANHLTDDYELGQRLHARGYRVALADFPVCTVFPAQSLRQVFAHQVRWTMTLRVAEPWGHLGLIFAQGLPWA
ncbi:MAG: glycosyltransferase, partial [Steroidobacteraceae bacterium]